MKARRHLQRGFALPTILIASVVMLIVLISAVSATASIRSALSGQYYDRLAREAAESGIARANACLQESAFIVKWSNTNKLYPNTTCSGGASCTNAPSCFVMSSGAVRTTFEVGAPVSFETSQTVTATGKVELIRPSGAVWRSYTASTSARVGIDLNLNTVAFGYDGRTGGAFFGTIAADGKMRAAGFNYNGQLGNGTTSNTTVPAPFQLSGTDRAAGIYTNFISQGYNMFTITDKGDVYGAGLNDHGQLGDGTKTDRSIPVKFNLPAGIKATYVGVGGNATFVTGDNNNIYAAGLCTSGMVGTNYTISGCSDRTSPARVALPTPTSDTNTLPTDDIVVDAQTAYVRMQGGRVYGWGRNNFSQLGDGTTTDSSVPKQVSAHGNVGQPKAIDIAFDGDTVYIADDNGDVKGYGRNDYGQMGGENITIYMPNAGKCLDNTNQNGLDLQLYTCNGTGAQQYTFRSDGTIYNANTNKCLDNKDGAGTVIRLWTCNGALAQKFVMRADGSIYNALSNKCINNLGYDNVSLGLWVCSGTLNEQFQLSITGNKKFALPASAGKAIKVTTDQWFVSVLTENGQVWSAGRNDSGQLGNGTTAMLTPYPVQFQLPSGVTAVDVATSAFFASGGGTTSNTFVIGSDGKVYGAGDNDYGQLGIGTTSDYQATPVAMNVIDGTGIRAKNVVSGYGTTIIITYGKKLYTVGNNSNGQLGDGTTTNSSTPKANKYTNVLPIAIF